MVASVDGLKPFLATSLFGKEFFLLPAATPLQNFDLFSERTNE